MRPTFLKTLVPLAAAMMTACLYPLKDEVTQRYEIPAGRYYKASEIASKPRDSALAYTDFETDRTYRDVLMKHPGCAVGIFEGKWSAYSTENFPEASLVLDPQRGAGGNGTDNPCQTDDSLTKMRDGWEETYWLRNITDSSFETCDGVNEICFGKCTAANLNPYGGCVNYDGSGTNDTDWTRWTK